MWNNIRRGILIIIIIALLFFILSGKMNFTILAMIALAAIIAPLLVKYPSLFKDIRSNDGSYIPPIKSSKQGVLAMIFLSVFSLLTICTLNNYFYADKEIYANNEHHIIKLKSVTIDNPQNYLLAGSNKDAFFDSKGFKGEIRIESIDTKNGYVNLNLKGFTQPIYQYELDEDKKRRDKVLNTKTLITFSSCLLNNDKSTPDKLVFKNKKNDYIYFWITECDQNKDWYDVLFSNYKEYTDSAIYNFEIHKNGQDTTYKYISNVTYICNTGNSLNTLIDGVPIDDFDFVGINIARKRTHPQSNLDNRSDNGATEYVLSLDSAFFRKNSSATGIEEIYSTKNSEQKIVVGSKNIISETIALKLDTILGTKQIMIGYGKYKTKPFILKRTTGNNSLEIEFKEPICHELYSTNNSKANNLYVTSSIIKDTEKKNSGDINVPGNVLEFDIFDNTDNNNRFNPFNISFVPGATTDSLFLLCDIDNSIVKENDVISAAGDNIHWNFSMVNLREKLPRIVLNSLQWVVFVVALLSFLSIGWQVYISKFENKVSRNTFSYAEYAMYVILIYLVALRCFVIWRVMTFRPIENITQLELDNIIYQTTAYKGFLAGILIFFGVIFLTKLWIYYSRKRNFNNQYTSSASTFTVDISSQEALLLSAANDSIYGRISNFVSRIGKPTGFAKLIGVNKIINYLGFNENSIGYSFVKAWLTLFIIAFAVYFIKERATIVVLVISYFIVDMIIYANNKYNTYKAELVDKKDEREHIVSMLLYSMLNMLFTIAAIIVITRDTGFVIMFATFSLFAITLKLLEVYTKMVHNIGNNLLWIYIAIAFVVVIIFANYKWIIIKALYSSFLILAVALILAAILVTILYSSIKEKLQKFQPRDIINISSIVLLPIIVVAVTFVYRDDISEIFKYIIVALLIIWFVYIIMSKGLKFICNYLFNVKHIIFSGVFAIFVVGVCFVVSNKIPANELSGHTLQRINVQVYEPHEALLLTKTSGDENRFLQASHNHWIIEQYYNRGRNVNFIGEDGLGYFKMQPQSRVGAMWNAQVTDIVLLRYIIAEHGTLLPVLIILLFLAMLYYGMKKTTYYRFTKSLLTQIPLLILVQALLVWLANTQRFIFFGQDFPMLSVTSTFMVLYFFVLIAIWIFAAIIESVTYRQYKENDRYDVICAFNKKHSILFCCLFICAILWMIGKKNIDVRDNSSKYEMTELFNKSSVYVDYIDNLFVVYQPDSNSVELPLKDNMHNVINDFNSNYKVENKVDTADYVCLLHRIRTISDNEKFRDAVNDAYTFKDSTPENKIQQIDFILHSLPKATKEDEKEEGKFNIIGSSIKDNDGICILSDKDENVNYCYNFITDTIKIVSKKDKNVTKDSVIVYLSEKISVEASIMRVNTDELLRNTANYQFYANNIDSLFDKKEYQFPLRIWRNYVERGSYQNSYSGLIHIHKVNSKLRIAMRDTYYDVSLPNRNKIEWKGNIVEKMTPIPLSDTLIRRADKKDKMYTYYQLPSSWVKKGETPHILTVHDTSGKIKITSIENNTGISIGSGIESTVAMHKDDVIENGKEIISLPIEKHSYWARNIRINGKQSFIYPQGKDLFWIWHFANAVKSQKDDSLRYVEGACSDSMLYANVEITLDKELSSCINKIFNEYTKDEYAQYNPSLSVIAADGNGHIHSMVDAKLANYAMDPNNNKKIANVSEELYMNRDGKRSVKERLFFDNMNLTHIKGGPGSTQKPLVWNAVASYIDYDWKNFKIAKYNKYMLTFNVEKGKDCYYIPTYNGVEMKDMLAIQSDERITYKSDKKLDKQVGDKESYMDLINYLANSSNYYNAIMVYLGLHPASMYDENKNFMSDRNTIRSDSNYVFRVSSNPFNMVKDSFFANYPFIITKNNKYLSLSRRIELKDFENSVLYKQFVEKFGMRSDLSPISAKFTENGDEKSFIIKRLGDNLYNDYFSQQSGYSGYAAPELSVLNLKGYSTTNYTTTKHKYQLANNGMQNIVLGGGDLWVVTPFEMAQLYGKMVTGNSKYAFTFDANNYSLANNSIDIGVDNSGYKKALPVAYQSMSQFFTHGTSGGGSINSGKNTIEANGNTYYLYGKTGTASHENKSKNKEEVTKNDIKRLAIIISDRKLEETKDRNKAKFFVLYFTFDCEKVSYFNSRFTKIATDVIKEVVNSSTFQNYMNQTSAQQ